MSSPGLAPPPPETRLPARAAPIAAVARTRPAISPPRGRPAIELGRGSVAVSLAAHALALTLLVVVLQIAPPLPVPERAAPVGASVDYIDLDWPAGVPGDGVAAVESSQLETPVTGADPALPRQQVGTAPLSFPTGVPTGIPAPNASSGIGGATGPGAAQGGAGAAGAGGRLRPGFRDPRLYVGPSALPASPTGTAGNHERYMESLTRRIEASNDSVGISSREPNTDWTVRDRSGNRWGLSEDGLHLGPLTIPDELVPRPAATGSNQKLEEAREEQRQREEIRRQEEDRARRAEQERAVRETRERAERERAAAKE